jgi:hypothetical protein
MTVAELGLMSVALAAILGPFRPSSWVGAGTGSCSSSALACGLGKRSTGYLWD